MREDFNTGVSGALDSLSTEEFMKALNQEKGLAMDLMRYDLEFEHLEEDLDRLDVQSLDDETREKVEELRDEWNSLTDRYREGSGWDHERILEDILGEGARAGNQELEQGIGEINEIHSEVKQEIYGSEKVAGTEIDYERIASEVTAELGTMLEGRGAEVDFTGIYTRLEDVESGIETNRELIESIEVPDTLTQEEVREAVSEELESYDDDSLTEQEVSAAVGSALDDYELETLDEQELEAAVDEALEEHDVATGEKVEEEHKKTREYIAAEEDDDGDGSKWSRRAFGAAAIAALFGGGALYESLQNSEQHGEQGNYPHAHSNDTTTGTPTTTTDRTTTTGTTTDTTTTEGPTTTGQEIKISELSHDEFVEEYQELSAGERQELFEDVEDYEELVDGDPDNMEIERVKVEYNPSDDPDDSEISYKLESGGAYSAEKTIPDSLARELLDLN